MMAIQRNLPIHANCDPPLRGKSYLPKEEEIHFSGVHREFFCTVCCIYVENIKFSDHINNPLNSLALSNSN